MAGSLATLNDSVAANNPKPELQGMEQSIGALAVNVAANNPIPALQDVTYKLGVLNDSVRDNNPMTGLALLIEVLGNEGSLNERLESIARAVRSLGRPVKYAGRGAPPAKPSKRGN